MPVNCLFFPNTPIQTAGMPRIMHAAFCHAIEEECNTSGLEATLRVQDRPRLDCVVDDSKSNTPNVVPLVATDAIYTIFLMMGRSIGSWSGHCTGRMVHRRADSQPNLFAFCLSYVGQSKIYRAVVSSTPIKSAGGISSLTFRCIFANSMG
jgi:hypothetical protein